jgi:hypothetical protein
MGSTLTIPAASALAPRTVIADPGDNPGVSKVRPGGILVWTNRSTTSPNFAIEFVDNGGRGPASPGDTLFGTGSIVIHVGKDTTGTFPYTIQYSSGPASPVDVVSRTFSVHSCVTC